MAYFLYGLFFVSCLVLIGAVLLQPGKTDAGALFTSNISSTSFTPRGAQSVLSKMTIIAATCFMLSALLLSMPGLTGNVSVLQTIGEESTEVAPAIDSNTAPDANSNVAADANANSAAPANSNSSDAPANTDAKAPVAEEPAEAAKPEEKKPETKKPETK